MENYKNDVFLTGFLTFKRQGKEFGVLMLSTTKATKTKQIPKVTFSKKFFEVLKNYNLGDKVSIRARVQSLKKGTNRQILLLESINLADDKDKGIIALPRNEAHFNGVLLSNYVSKGKRYITLLTDKNNKVSFVNISFIGARGNALKNVKPGKKIEVYAKVIRKGGKNIEINSVDDINKIIGVSAKFLNHSQVSGHNL